jgi:hypothetical protein
MTVADSQPLMDELQTAYVAGGEVDLAHATAHQWAEACHYLLEAGEIEVLNHVVRQLNRSYPELPYLATLRAFFDRIPANLPPPLPFKDDPDAALQILRRPGCDATLICFCAANGTLGLPLNLMHQWHGRLPVNLVYLKDVLDLSGAFGYPPLGQDPASTVAALRRLIAELGTRRLYTLGVSTGGYASLHYGLQLGAAATLCLSGMTDMTQDFNDGIAGQSSIHRDILQCAPEYAMNLRDAYAKAPHPPHVMLAFCAGSERDRMHAWQMTGLAGVELIEIAYYSQHNVVDPLIREGRYLSLLCRLLGTANGSKPD